MRMMLSSLMPKKFSHTAREHSRSQAVALARVIDHAWSAMAAAMA
jgi:hypothetical protein